MTTNFDNNALTSSGGFKPSTKDTPIDIRSRVATETDILEIPNPYVGMIVYVQDTGKRFEVLTIKDIQSDLSKVSRVDQYKEFMVGGSQVDLSAYATEKYVDEEIEKIELTPGPKGEQGPKGDDGYTPVKGVDYFTADDKVEMLEEYATEDYVDDMFLDYTGGKKQVYLTQEEYYTLSDTEINDPNTIYNITDAVEVESVIPVDLTMNNNVLNLVDNDGSVIGEGVEIDINQDLSKYALKTDLPTKVSDLSNDAGYATEKFVTDSMSVITPGGGTSNELILTSPNGTKFRVIVSDAGDLSAEMIIKRGNIMVSAETLNIIKGMSGTFTVHLDAVPSTAQAVNIASDNTAVIVTPNSLTFSSDNYNVAQDVTINIPENEEVIDNSIVTITLSSEGVSNKNVTVTVTTQAQEPELDIISDGILMYFDSTSITAAAGTPINNTSINDAIVPNQTIGFRNFKDDGSDGITDDYKAIHFEDSGIIEPMMNDVTTAFGGTEETSIRTIEIFGKFDGAIDPINIKNISGIAHQHKPINYSRQIFKRASDGFEPTISTDVVRQMNFPAFGSGNMTTGYFHVAFTDNGAKDSGSSNICNWLSFGFGSGANMGSLRHTNIYAVRLYNRVLSSDELAHNMAIDLAKVNYTENIQE